MIKHTLITPRGLKRLILGTRKVAKAVAIDASAPFCRFPLHRLRRLPGHHGAAHLAGPEAGQTAIPAGRVAETGDVSAAALFLASEEAVYVQGVVLNVDGGLAIFQGR